MPAAPARYQIGPGVCWARTCPPGLTDHGPPATAPAPASPGWSPISRPCTGRWTGPRSWPVP